MNVLEEKTGITFIPKHIDCVDINEKGQLVLAASNLAGNCWNGLSAVFNDPQFAPNIPHVDYGALNETGCTNVEWFDENKIVLSTDAGTIELWELKEAPVIDNVQVFSPHDDVCCSLNVNKYTSQIISSSWDCTIKVWDLEVELAINNLRIHSDRVLDVLWNPTISDVFASVSCDGYTLIHDNRAKEKPVSITSYTEETYPTSICWLSEQDLCVGFENGEMITYDIRNNNILRTFRNHKKTINEIAYLRSSDSIITVSDDMTVKVSANNDIASVLYTDTRHTDYVRSVCIDYHSSFFYTSGWDCQVNRHDIKEVNKSME